MIDRRGFSLGLAGAAFAALAACARNPQLAAAGSSPGLGPLRPDPNGLLELPDGFSYRVISEVGTTMSDGFRVPDRFDGMGSFAAPDGRVILVRNHELRPNHHKDGPAPGRAGATSAFDRDERGALPGGTTTLIWNPRTGKVDEDYLSLAGTIRNCAGGVTPWGSWLSCEEDVSRAGKGLQQDHGWVFEVPAAGRGLADPIALKALGRFNHEAAAVDPRTGIVYLTEDRDDGLLYRVIPNARGDLKKGGRLQAMAIGDAGFDTRNWGSRTLAVTEWRSVRWIDLDGVEAPDDDLRLRGARAGAALVARGEGLWMGSTDLYGCATSGGLARLGQVFRYRPSRFEGTADERSEPGQFMLFVESTDPAMFHYGDNLVVAPNGHLVVCEDQSGDAADNHIRVVAADGRISTLGRTPLQTEFAGACFSPDGRTLFVNLYSPGRTLAITGPWDGSRAV
jgi:uncharacterized protein